MDPIHDSARRPSALIVDDAVRELVDGLEDRFGALGRVGPAGDRAQA